MRTRSSVKNQNALYKYLTGNRVKVDNVFLQQKDNSIVTDYTFDISVHKFNSTEDAIKLRDLSMGRFLRIMLDPEYKATIDEFYTVKDTFMEAVEYLNPTE
ncbi:hypothetical protein [Chryseobacterium sp. JV274]|uniref:hypothetical protein n=1 Tax=Chryseobacterium sp. JV274 TaxID=1932669 RepID=UPI0015C1FB5A|nr:hypothetical protein [Chryseobacterium sp. JV274]CAD0220272.1 protein of unknown function [Chryseobacterium sp. JV274]